ncbi:MAG: NADH-quinone oxidoreductase subunit N [Chloroflexi bacterium]|nr:NADH-quinone oxidoreductase subunit N [Chloroflexota bacterium]
MPDLSTLIALSPELILAAFGLLILLFDLIWRERAGNFLAWFAALGFATALIATLALWGTTRPLFGNSYVVDNFASFFKIIGTVAGFALVLVSLDWLKARTRALGDFFALFTFAILAMLLMASSTSLLMIYLSVEFLSYTSYLLTGFLREDKKSNESAIKYFLYGAITSAVMLYGLSLLYGVSGSLNLNDLAFLFSSTVDASIRNVGMLGGILVLAGLGFKISMVPFHQWAPDAYEGAPTPVTAFLSIGPKAAGFAVLLRVFLVGLPALTDKWTGMIGVFAIATMMLGNLLALQQTNIKRLLAYSSIAQAGYMLIGLVAVNDPSLGNPFNGLNGLLIYVAAYLFTNLGAFICVIAVEGATGAVDIADYAGMVKRSPLAAGMLAFFFLSLAGIPPTVGFIGKFFVFGAALKAGYLFLAAIGVVMSVVSVFYYFNVVRACFFLEPKDATRIQMPRLVTASLVVSGAAVLLLFLFTQPLFNFAMLSMSGIASP